MPWQGHLYIGQKVRSHDEAIEIFKRLDAEKNRNFDNTEDVLEERFHSSVTYKGREFTVTIKLMEEWEGGEPYSHDEYTDAMVGFNLTSRYRGAIIDHQNEHGREEPFEFDPADIVDILSQVNEWWPEARAIIWTVFY